MDRDQPMYESQMLARARASPNPVAFVNAHFHVRNLPKPKVDQENQMDAVTGAGGKHEKVPLPVQSNSQGQVLMLS